MNVTTVIPTKVKTFKLSVRGPTMRATAIRSIDSGPNDASTAVVRKDFAALCGKNTLLSRVNNPPSISPKISVQIRRILLLRWWLPSIQNLPLRVPGAYSMLHKTNYPGLPSSSSSIPCYSICHGIIQGCDRRALRKFSQNFLRPFSI